MKRATAIKNSNNAPLKNNKKGCDKKEAAKAHKSPKTSIRSHTIRDMTINRE